jgi:hypothetical protein
VSRLGWAVLCSGRGGLLLLETLEANAVDGAGDDAATEQDG